MRKGKKKYYYPDYDKKWREQNKDRVKKYNKSFRSKHPDKPRKTPERLVYLKNYREKNKDKHTVYLKIWKLKNRDKIIGYNRKRNCRNRIEEKFTDIGIKWLNELWNKTTHCELCHCEMDNNGKKYPNGKQLDHILPLNAGGTHTKNNVRFICMKCNLERPKDGSDLLTLAQK